MISVVVRTRNEAVWIERCLRAVSLQSYPDFEVVVVDNTSTDGTRDIVAQFDVRLVSITDADFTFGRALNRGIAASRGDLLALLSGHCIPATERWLDRLALAMAGPGVAGAYGRQEPLPDSNDFDKRDLWTTFGLDRRVQTRDYFFHNANSIIRRDVWETVPFNEDIYGVEDREWARRVLERGFRVVYEPAATVFHHHGIHQGRDEQRAARVARVIELMEKGEM